MRLTLGHIRRILLCVTVVVGLLLMLILAVVLFVPRGSSARTSEPAASPADSSPPSSAPATPTPLASPSGAPLDAYAGLASWVDIYDDRAWRNPAAAIEDMSSHGVKTLFVQTSHYHSPGPFFDAAALRTFISEGHARGMRIVAWYLPNMKPGSVDYARVKAAVGFRTADGQRFDSVALDIESSAIDSEAMRNRGLAALSAKIRKLVGPTYPLGAVIPAPVGLRRPHSVWGNFPYSMLPKYYDVLVPMGYYTFHGRGAKSAFADATQNLRILRSQPGCSAIPIHLIGGIAEDSSAGQVQAFAQAVREGGCLGASLYGWAGTRPAAWKALATIYR